MSSFQQIFAHGGGDESEIEEQPEWSGPPDAELGVAVPLAVELGRSESAVVALRQAVAYSTGATIDFLAVVRGISARATTSLFHDQHSANPEEDTPDAFLRLGIEIADGSRVSNLGNPRRHLWKPGVMPEGPIFAPQSGSSGGSGPGRVALHQSYWLWPLPPRGLLRVFAEWPAFGLELSSVELDTAPLLEAAQRSQPLWPRS